MSRKPGAPVAPVRTHTPQRSAVYLMEPRGTLGRELFGEHRWVVVSEAAINALGMVTCVPISTRGMAARSAGMAAMVNGQRGTTGMALCNQVRSFDLERRVERGLARQIDDLDAASMAEIAYRLSSLVDPGS